MEVYNPFINETDIEDLPRIYFINKELDIHDRANEVTSSIEWFGMWRNSDISVNRPIICSSVTLDYFYTQASPDNVYNIQRIRTCQEALRYLYNVDNLRPYEKKKDKFFKKAITLIDEKKESLDQITLNRLNIQDIDEKNIYSLWKNSDTFDRWLIQNYVLINKEPTTYLYQVLNSIEEFTDNELVEAVYTNIFATNDLDCVQDRKTIIQSISGMEHEIRFTDRMISFYNKKVLEIIRKRTTRKIENIDFEKDEVSLIEKKDVLEEAFNEKLYLFLTSYSSFERKLIIWLYRLGVIRNETIGDLYPQLATYISESSIESEPKEFSNQLDSYFNEYRKCRLSIDPSNGYDEIINVWNSDENRFYSWYLNGKIDYPEIYIKKHAKNERIYVLDGVGAEFLEYIVKLLCIKGFSVERMSYAKAHLPSITTVAKDYYDFDNDWIRDFDEEVIHGGLYYHVDNIEKSLFVVEKIIDKIICQSGDEPFIITADHGSSIGHKLSKKDKKYNFDKSEHDGRCYLNKTRTAYPPTNDYVVYDDEAGHQWIVALNQQSLYNNSKYSVHGGGTPEEVIVPVIFARRGKTQERTYKVNVINLKVSGLQKQIEVRILPKPDDKAVRLLAKDGTNTEMVYLEPTKTWKGTLKRGIEQEITIRVNNRDYNFVTIPPTKMGADLFDD